MGLQSSNIHLIILSRRTNWGRDKFPTNQLMFIPQIEGMEVKIHNAVIRLLYTSTYIPTHFYYIGIPSVNVCNLNTNPIKYQAIEKSAVQSFRNVIFPL